MALWIIDTDHTSLFLAGNKSVIAQVAEHSDNIAITIITVQELFNGWNGKLNDPRQTNNLSNLYTKLWQTTEFFKIITILNFDRDAEACYNNLRQNNRNLAKKRLAVRPRVILKATRKSAKRYPTCGDGHHELLRFPQKT